MITSCYAAAVACVSPLIPTPSKHSRLHCSTASPPSQTQNVEHLYALLQHSPPTSAHYASALQSCNCLHLGRQIHAHALKHDFSNHHEFLGTKLVLMYGKCGGFDDACLLFDRMPLRNVYTWTAILSVCVERGVLKKALLLFIELLMNCVGLEFFVFPVVLKACAGLRVLGLGRELHGFVAKCGFLSNVYVGNALIDMYGKCGVQGDAMKVFDGMSERDCVSWNSVISGCAANGMVFDALEYLISMELVDKLKPNLVSWSAAIGGFAQSGYDEEALELLYRMVESDVKPNAQTLASILPVCARLEALELGKEIHVYVMRHGMISNPFAVNGLIDVYRRCNDMRSAREIFLRFSARNLVSYNTMIVGYCENNELGRAKELFECMELDGVKRDTISWSSLISGYCDNEKFSEALEMFRVMQFDDGIEADSFTLGSTASACAALTALRPGKEIHGHAIRRGLYSNNFISCALMEMYFRCHELEAAEVVFYDTADTNTVTWNILISGYAHANQVNRIQESLSLMRKEGFEPNIYTWNGIVAGLMDNGENEFALKMFSEMQTSETKPDVFTVGMILTICSRLISIERGKQSHAYSIRFGYDSHVHVGAALVDMYAKCGNIRLAKYAFDRISHHNLVSFNTMLSGYAMHGLGHNGLALFHQMLADGSTPDAITFISVLSSCVHNGSIEDGHRYFNMMTGYGIEPELQHYTCMIDLLSRSGQLSEAYDLICKMPMQPDVVAWSALLGGCVIHRNVRLGEIAAKRLIKLDENNISNYVLLSNLYGIVRRRDDLAKTRQIVKEKAMNKSPGCSWIENKGQVHVFLAGDACHKQADEIYATVKRLNSHMRMQDDVLVM
ncbi:pentatricopeptide repeat-containing protein At2g13600-like [Dioscorea cayenensis subsp. rotundata]|uniref:Pentatricopeptide repeat-containing protein At2g13600-like n=1 Tax=Dioscorea cayennensis subsp. rotundata TaxID=55577 RepID=A0AB40B7V1_DIOCR|nr:pentatricopeptide repeat-containing protein At2g13600-like [Dioscorea cayenensis subsp. rotundata]